LNGRSQLLADVSSGWRTGIAVASGVALGQLGAILQPYLVGSLVEGFHRSTAQAGYILGAEMACYSIALLLSAYFVDRLSLARAAMTGAALSAASGLFVAFNVSDTTLYLSSCFYGVGQGMTFAAALAAASHATAPERVLGIAVTIALLVDSAILAFVPYAEAAWGPSSFFFVMSAASVVIGLGLTQMDRAHVRQTHERIRQVPQLRTAFLTLMLVMFGVGSGAVYAFVERVARSIGISGETAGLIIMFSLLIGAVGSVAAAWLNLKWGRAIPLYLALLVVGLSSFTLMFSLGPVSYSVSIVAFQIAYTFAFPYMIGASAYLDSTGRLAAYSGGIIFLASAAGAALAGEVASSLSFGALGALAFCLCTLACFAVRPVLSDVLKRPLLAETKA